MPVWCDSHGEMQACKVARPSPLPGVRHPAVHSHRRHPHCVPCHPRFPVAPATHCRALCRGSNRPLSSLRNVGAQPTQSVTPSVRCVPVSSHLPLLPSQGSWHATRCSALNCSLCVCSPPPAGPAAPLRNARAASLPPIALAPWCRCWMPGQPAGRGLRLPPRRRPPSGERWLGAHTGFLLRASHCSKASCHLCAFEFTVRNPGC
jgi:hypothetical protein